MDHLKQNRSFLNLAGQWLYALDPHDRGEEERWHIHGLPSPAGKLEMPGTLSGNGIGEQTEWGSEMSPETVRSLRQRHRYVGVAWYECEIDIPQEWSGKRLIISLERVMLKSTLWLNDRQAGEQDSLSTPHCFDITELARYGARNRLTVRVDNRDIYKLGEYPSAYTDETQTIWNGMIGRLELLAIEPVHLSGCKIYPDLTTRSIRLEGTWSNRAPHEAQIQLTVMARLKNAAQPHSTIPQDYVFTVAGYGSYSFELEYGMGESVKLWDEFTPNVYELLLSSHSDVNGTTFTSEQAHNFGMRTFRNDGTQFKINNRATFLRGTLECCIFPLTGHPPMDNEAWSRLFQTVKDYGLNHVRFHSWCPPEAAFEAADRIGIYVQAEGPVWMDTWNTPVGAHPEHYVYLPEEAQRIIAAYGNHPSFCLFSNGNELNGDFDLLHQMIEALKSGDNRRVYTLTTNWDRPLDPADDYFCSQSVDGKGARGQYFPDELATSTMLDFREAVVKRKVPLVSHEVGQYTVYPDVTEIDAYTGVLRPVNLEVIRTDLERKDLLGDIHNFVRGSGMLALQLYREEIEAALRTPELGGFQLLDLHDFPGQSTATVGILNAFWESKGLIEPDRFRNFCNPTVLLLRMPKRIYTSKDVFHAQAEVAHFGPIELQQSEVLWEIIDDGGNRLDYGILPPADIPVGSGIPLGDIVSDAFQMLKRSAKLTVSLEMGGGKYRNEWPVWVYSEEEELPNEESGIYYADVLNELTERHLAAGGKVLLTPDSKLRHSVPGKFYPVFWSPVHFATENPCGIVVKNTHPVFKLFPTEDYAEYQWKDLLDRSVSLGLDHVHIGKNPLIQVIPNFYHNRRMSNLLECRVGTGRLIICGIDIQNDLEARPAARQLRRSILAYMHSDAFQPSEDIDITELRKLLESRQDEVESGLTGKELAIGKQAASDSIADEAHAAFKGNDGIGHTMWLAADEAAGHWWQADLGSDKAIAGTRVKFHQAGNFLYVIQVSSDGESWRLAVNQTGQTSEEQIRVDMFKEQARFVRIVYNKVPVGVRAGHFAFEIFGY